MNAPAKPYAVTTIGALAELAKPALERAACACAAKIPQAIGGVEDVWLLYNPFVWAAQKLLGKAIDAASGDDSSDSPSSLDRIAAQLGIDPVEASIELMGYSGLGRYWPALRIVGGVAAVGGAAYLGAHALKSRRTAKRRKGKADDATPRRRS